MSAAAPRSTAFETATVIPRSLKEQVGFRPSYFKYTSQSRPTISLSRGEKIKGVPPSPNEMIGVESETGRNSRYRAMTPLPRGVVSFTAHFYSEGRASARPKLFAAESQTEKSD